ncbi:hypothetical protein ACFRKB_27480 [Streptomyces scopuliridis]|uniref:hypothetical protein n=1 Tax=Streptomyces scopuliridis TaxID=452529 RepID=UPI003695DEC3
MTSTKGNNMRIRRTIATAAVGAALVLGVSVGPAFAASSEATTVATIGSDRVAQSGEKASIAAGTAHYWATYNSLTDCTVAGIMVVQSNPNRYYRAECTPIAGSHQFKLWIWY